MPVSLRLLAVALLLSAPLVASAQSDLDRLSGASAGSGASTILDEAGTAPVGGEDEAVPNPPAPTTPVPVDGGLSLLALAGAGYAAKRLRARRA